MINDLKRAAEASNGVKWLWGVMKKSLWNKGMCFIIIRHRLCFFSFSSE
jgi:hypothetical protein